MDTGQRPAYGAVHMYVFCLRCKAGHFTELGALVFDYAHINLCPGSIRPINSSCTWDLPIYIG